MYRHFKYTFITTGVQCSPMPCKTNCVTNIKQKKKAINTPATILKVIKNQLSKINVSENFYTILKCYETVTQIVMYIMMMTADNPFNDSQMEESAFRILTYFQYC